MNQNIHLNSLVSGYAYALKVSTQNTLNKNSPSSETRRISLKSNYGNNLSTDGSSMVNNVDAQESPINNLPQKEPKSSSALKEPSTTSNFLPNYQNMNGSALQRVETISKWTNSKKNGSLLENFSQKSPPKDKFTPEKLYYNNSPTKSSQKTPKTSNNSTPEKKSYHNISYQDGQLNLNQADINTIKNKWITNITVSNNSLKNESSQNNSPRAQPDITSGSGYPRIFKCPDSGLPVFSTTPAKATTANISNFQLFRSSHNGSFLENSSKKCPTTKNPTPVHEEKKFSIKCYVCKSTSADNPHLKMYLANINSYNFKFSDFKCNICWARAKQEISEIRQRGN